MTEQRKEEITNVLMGIYNGFESDGDYPFEPNMYWLVSSYNHQYDNPELIGGNWVQENCTEPLKSLPPY